MSKILIDEALRLADALEDTDGAHDHEDAAAELRRLHAENQALRQALADAALDKMAENARELGLSYEQPAQQESVEFLANGTRFKISCDSRQSGGKIHGIPPELNGRWVALVAAEDDCHLKLTHPALAHCEAGPEYCPECKTEAEKTAFAFGWYKALESVREEKEPDPDELTIAYMSGVYEGKKRKPWVGLTDEEFVELCSADLGTAALIRAVEANLKEKNT